MSGPVQRLVTFSAEECEIATLQEKLCKAMRRCMDVKAEPLDSTIPSALGVVDTEFASSVALDYEVNDQHGQIRRIGQTILPVELRFSQRSISGTFRDGRTLRMLVDDLKSRRVDPMKDPRMRLNVFRWPGRGDFSVDNRRLSCLQVEGR